MATPRRVEPAADEVPVLGRPVGPTIADRISAFAMLDGMKDSTQAQKCLRLSLIGFTNTEIAAILQTTPAVVSTNLYNERKKGAKAPTKRPGSSSE